MNEPARPRRIAIERLEIVASRAAAREIGASPSALDAFARDVAEGLGQRLAAGPMPPRPSIGRVEMSLPHGVSSAKAVVNAIERRLHGAAGGGARPQSGASPAANRER
jgi:hypothetical protein